MSECISVNKRVYFKEEIMIFDLDRYIDEPLVYFDDKKRIDDQKIFLLGVRIRSDMVDLLISGIKAKDIIVKALDPSEDPSFGLINMVAASALSDWGFELTDPKDIKEVPLTIEDDQMDIKEKYVSAEFMPVKDGEAKLLKKTITNFKISDSKHREGEVIRALQDDFAVISDQLNKELSVFPAPMREMIMMTLLDRFHSWEKSNWDVKDWG